MWLPALLAVLQLAVKTGMCGETPVTVAITQDQQTHFLSPGIITWRHDCQEFMLTINGRTIKTGGKTLNIENLADKMNLGNCKLTISVKFDEKDGVERQLVVCGKVNSRLAYRPTVGSLRVVEIPCKFQETFRIFFGPEEITATSAQHTGITEALGFKNTSILNAPLAIMKNKNNGPLLDKFAKCVTLVAIDRVPFKPGSEKGAREYNWKDTKLGKITESKFDGNILYFTYEYDNIKTESQFEFHFLSHTEVLHGSPVSPDTYVTRNFESANVPIWVCVPEEKIPAKDAYVMLRQCGQNTKFGRITDIKKETNHSSVYLFYSIFEVNTQYTICFKTASGKTEIKAVSVSVEAFNSYASATGKSSTIPLIVKSSVEAVDDMVKLLTEATPFFLKPENSHADSKRNGYKLVNALEAVVTPEVNTEILCWFNVHVEEYRFRLKTKENALLELKAFTASCDAHMSIPFDASSFTKVPLDISFETSDDYITIEKFLRDTSTILFLEPARTKGETPDYGDHTREVKISNLIKNSTEQNSLLFWYDVEHTEVNVLLDFESTKKTLVIFGFKHDSCILFHNRHLIRIEGQTQHLQYDAQNLPKSAGRLFFGEGKFGNARIVELNEEGKWSPPYSITIQPNPELLCWRGFGLTIVHFQKTQVGLSKS